MKQSLGRSARLCAVAAVVALSLSVSLESNADVIYRIVDSSGQVTYSNHPPAAQGKLTVTKIQKETGAVLPYSSKGSQDEPSTTTTITPTSTTDTTNNTTSTTEYDANNDNNNRASANDDYNYNANDYNHYYGAITD